MSNSSSNLSHSSIMNTYKFSKFRALSFTNCRIRPGVPIKMCGLFSPLSILIWSFTGTPPKKHSLRMLGRYTVNLSHSFLIWWASSRVLQRMSTELGLGSSSNWWSTDRIKTAVFPLPETAWQITSLPIIAYGMHSCCTSEGCSKPHSLIALCNSFLRSKSLKLVMCTPV